MRDPALKICKNPDSLRLHIDALEAFRNTKLTVGFAEGSFDILHNGHMLFLHKARKECDFLVVSISSDESVRHRKGAERPYMNREMRANAVANLPSVDGVIIFQNCHKSTGFKPPLSDYRKIRPSVLFLGNDYLGNLPEYTQGITQKIKMIEAETGLRTTNIAETIQSRTQG